MNTENMSFEEEKKEYIKSLIDKMNIHQLRKAIVMLEELLKEQEGGN